MDQARRGQTRTNHADGAPSPPTNGTSMLPASMTSAPRASSCEAFRNGCRRPRGSLQRRRVSAMGMSAALPADADASSRRRPCRSQGIGDVFNRKLENFCPFAATVSGEFAAGSACDRERPAWRSAEGPLAAGRIDTARLTKLHRKFTSANRSAKPAKHSRGLDHIDVYRMTQEL